MRDNTGRKLRVAIVAPSTEVLGGQSIQAERLVTAFESEEGIDLTLIPNNPNLNLLGFLQKIRFVRTIATSIKFWSALATKLINFDVVQIFSSGTTSYVISTLPPLFVARFYGKKVILNYHTGEAAAHLENWGWLATSTMREFDRIVVPSQFLVDIFAGFKLRAESIFNIVDSKNFVFRERKPVRPRFLSNRIFEKNYNVSCVLRGFKIIQEKLPKASLTIAGSGSEELKLKKLAKDLDVEHVEFVGRVSQDKMPEVFNKADIYLNSSNIDNMPLSIIEAFSCGLPVVSSNAGGIPYIVTDGETGLLFEVNDCGALAAQAVKLLENEQLSQKIIDKARRECVKYSWNNVRDSWRNMYLDIASQ